MGTDADVWTTSVSSGPRRETLTVCLARWGAPVNGAADGQGRTRPVNGLRQVLKPSRTVSILTACIVACAGAAAVVTTYQDGECGPVT